MPPTIKDDDRASEKLHVEHPTGGAAGQVVDHPSRAIAIPISGGTQLERRVAPNFSIDDMMRIAEVIARGGLFGSNDPNAVATLCMLAHAEGQHPAVVFRDYNIIQGRPSKTAEAMQRDFLLAGGRIEWHYLGNDKGDATFSHPQGGTMRIVWDVERAKAAGLWGKKNRDGSPGMWQRYPRQMFRSRVISEGVRTIWPAATGGLYEENEVIDIVTEDGPKTRTSPTEEELAERRRNAEIFVKNQIKAVEETQDFAAFDSLRKQMNREVRVLARRQPELYQKLMRSYEDRENEFNGYDPTTGKSMRDEPDPDGEPMDVYSVFERRLRQCRSPKDVEKVDRDWCKVRAAQNDETIGLIDDMVCRRRQSFQRGQR